MKTLIGIVLVLAVIAGFAAYVHHQNYVESEQLLQSQINYNRAKFNLGAK